jgi:hypothetical protein
MEGKGLSLRFLFQEENFFSTQKLKPCGLPDFQVGGDLHSDAAFDRASMDRPKRV